MSSALATSAAAHSTPMFRQYWQIKAEVADPDTILFFHVGDFYEMFFDDARIAAPILEIALTCRNANDPDPIPLCGIPIHAAENYIPRLLATGKKVAICEQIEDPKTTKGVVKRAVTRIFTPGAQVESERLVGHEANYLAAVHPHAEGFALAVIDISTGEFRVTNLRAAQAVPDELERLQVREVLFASSATPPWTRLRGVVSLVADTNFSAELLPTLAGSATLSHAQQCAAAAVWEYLRYTKLAGDTVESFVAQITAYETTDYVVIDDTTQRNLELFVTAQEGRRDGSLINVLDATNTAPGARLLRHALRYPLRDIAQITARLDAVAWLVAHIDRRERTRDYLSGIADLERLSARVAVGTVSPRELSTIAHSLTRVAPLAELLAPSAPLLEQTARELDACPELTHTILQTLVDAPPPALKEGRVIREGVNAELDQFRALAHEGERFLAALETQERARTGIASLKIRYNRVFGYYIEITHAHREKVPSDYIRKQTLTNAERYITPALKEFEEKVLSANERAAALEQSLYAELCRSVCVALPRLQRTARALARLDLLANFAHIAVTHDYVRPELVDAPVLEIRGGRHPVVEQRVARGTFVANDCVMGVGGDARVDTRAAQTVEPRGSAGHASLLIITGPNMAGKSTIMRQVAIITLLAHIGAYVPASHARVGCTDRIFTRVGASDNMAEGQSTFMVEMSEAATIVRESTAQSLIIIDELGRGTSTYDGLAIAWAVAEYLHTHVHARTLFATHYHELAALADLHTGVANVCMKVKEWNDHIIFLHTLTPGAADRSYGIEVARLAGLPDAITKRAREILQQHESTEHALARAGTPRVVQHNLAENVVDNTSAADVVAASDQLSLFTTADPALITLRDRVRALDPNQLTPMQALTILTELRATLQ